MCATTAQMTLIQVKKIVMLMDLLFSVVLYARQEVLVAQHAGEGEAGREVAEIIRGQGLRWELLVVDGPRDEHPNEIAHRIAAQRLVRVVDALVPREASSSAP